LRRGLDRDRYLDRRTGLLDRRDGGTHPEARYIRFDTYDSGYYNGWDLASAMHPQTILAYAWNDQPLTMYHGAPLRLYSPIKLGYN
jgi:Sulfite oxidase and related enzymes